MMLMAIAMMKIGGRRHELNKMQQKPMCNASSAAVIIAAVAAVRVAAKRGRYLPSDSSLQLPGLGGGALVIAVLVAARQHRKFGAYCGWRACRVFLSLLIVSHASAIG